MEGEGNVSHYVKREGCGRLGSEPRLVDRIGSIGYCQFQTNSQQGCVLRYQKWAGYELGRGCLGEG